MSWQVVSPWIDLRREPVAASSQFEMRDLFQESQLLLGEEVNIIKDQGEWVYIEALEQKRFSLIHGWQGYPGWIQRSDLIQISADTACDLVVHAYQTDALEWPSLKPLNINLLMGSKLRSKERVGEWWVAVLPDGREIAVSADAVSSEPAYAIGPLLLARAQHFVGSPYFWGGCSPSLCAHGWTRTGVDCSALVHLLYRTLGITVPRDAHDQWLVSAKISALELKLGDVIFTFPDVKPDRADHVMIFVSGDQVLEASLTVGLVRYITLKQKLDCSLAEMANGTKPNGVSVAFGRFRA